MAEYLPSKQDVEGSTPFSRSIAPAFQALFFLNLIVTLKTGCRGVYSGAAH